MRIQRKYHDYAVVLGLGVNGLAHARALGRHGIKVLGIFSAFDTSNLGRLSRYCEPILVPKTPAYESDLLIRLRTIAEKLSSKPVLFASSDYFVDFISDNRNELRKYCNFNIPDADLLKIVSNKRLIGQAAQKHGIRYPDTAIFDSHAALERVSRQLRYPRIIKPNDSYSVIFPGKNHIAQDRNELLAFYGQHPELIDKTLTQQIVPGKETGIYQCTGYFNSRGKAVQFCTIQKIHQYPPHFGITMFGKTKSLPYLSEKAISFLESLGYTGFASIEFKFNEKDNNYYLIEINPRLPWYCALFESAGINLPLICYLDQKRPEDVQRHIGSQREDVYWMHFRNELTATLQRKMANEPAGLFELIFSLIKTRSFAYWRTTDPAPFLGSLYDLGAWLTGKLKENLRLRMDHI